MGVVCGAAEGPLDVEDGDSIVVREEGKIVSEFEEIWNREERKRERGVCA